MDFIGRNQEKKILLDLLQSDKSELVAVLGRRRVGKTFLVKSVYKDKMLFQMTGLYKSTVEEHMERFAKRLGDAYGLEAATSKPKNWFEAFDMLQTLITKQKKNTKKVIFLDEFPWLATNKSRFLTAFTDFWNSFVADRKDLIVVICGSSASWMIKKVLKNKGGLHNRVTKRIALEPFSLAETEQFLRKKGIVIGRSDIVQLYMALGGIPYYLDMIEKGESTVQAMDRICFDKNAPLYLEYDELFGSLFNNSTRHKKIIQLLANHPMGMTRERLLASTDFHSGGGFTDLLDELIYSGFITSEVPFGKSNNESILKLRDFYTLYYHKYIKSLHGKSVGVWTKLSTMPTWKSWIGLAFENVCFYHKGCILRALKIDGILNSCHNWSHRGSEEMQGAQIDLLIDRADNVINICEIKYNQTPYVITADYAQNIKTKLASFSHFTKTKKALFVTFITSSGIQSNKYAQELVQNEVSLHDLFVV
jgi:uncharacterized protein